MLVEFLIDYMLGWCAGVSWHINFKELQGKMCCDIFLFMVNFRMGGG